MALAKLQHQLLVGQCKRQCCVQHTGAAEECALFQHRWCHIFTSYRPLLPSFFLSSLGLNVCLLLFFIVKYETSSSLKLDSVINKCKLGPSFCFMAMLFNETTLATISDRYKAKIINHSLLFIPLSMTIELSQISGQIENLLRFLQSVCIDCQIILPSTTTAWSAPLQASQAHVEEESPYIITNSGTAIVSTPVLDNIPLYSTALIAGCHGYSSALITEENHKISCAIMNYPFSTNRSLCNFTNSGDLESVESADRPSLTPEYQHSLLHT
jgi:hypothetical protein